jgi:hypothetical protein
MRIEKLIGLMLCIGLMGMSAGADEGGGGFHARLVGSAVGEHVAGIPSGGAPWKVARGEASVSGSGKIEVEIRGLLISSVSH